MIRLKALRRFPYKGRTLKKGASFVASNKDARLLRLLRRAAFDRAPVTAEGPAAAPAAAPQATLLDDAPPSDGLAALREEYFQAAGKRAFHGWDAETLRAKIADLKAGAAE